MKRATLPVAVVGLILLASCGGSGSPSGPGPQPTVTPSPAAEAPVVTDGWTEQPVAAEAEPPTVRSGQSLVVRAPGYLPREQVYELQPIALWAAMEGYVRELVYDWEFSDGSFRMVRWETPFTVSFDGTLGEDQVVRNRARQVLDEIGNRTGLQIPIGPGGEVLIKIDPSVSEDGAVARALLDFRGTTIIGGTIEFIDREEIVGGNRGRYHNTFLHEMGHIIGLAHSPDTTDVMTPAEGRGTGVHHYQHSEAVALHMMYFHREPGNRPPDRAPALGAASWATPLRTVIID